MAKTTQVIKIYDGLWKATCTKCKWTFSDRYWHTVALAAAKHRH